jgi:hypothetical protein
MRRASSARPRRGIPLGFQGRRFVEEDDKDLVRPGKLQRLIVELDCHSELPLRSVKRGFKVDQSSLVKAAGIISAVLPEPTPAGKSFAGGLVLVAYSEGVAEIRLGKSAKPRPPCLLSGNQTSDQAGQRSAPQCFLGVVCSRPLTLLA